MLVSAPRFAVIIPARYQSQRYPGKPLALLTGAGGTAKSLIQRSWEAASAIPGAAGVWVATDDARIADAVAAFGGRVVMTSPDCRNGTERCADALDVLGSELTEAADIIVNLQGDAPLTPTFVVEGLVAALAVDTRAIMATPALRCSASTYAHLVKDQSEGRVGGTTVVANRQGHALYFSKRVLPHVPDSLLAQAHEAVFLHLGVYAYRPEALRLYAGLAPSVLEDLEGLEQLRFLETERPIRVVPFEPIGWDCIELNNPGDVPAIEAVLRQRGLD
jgi:3-deoxy-manno-octulosonate cytidylyltransferase (CMP-KDO synthetase)